MSLRVLRHNGVPTHGATTAPPEGLTGCAGCQVRHLAVCSALPLEQARELEALAGDLSLPAGELLVREGQPRRGVFSVTSGALRRIRLLPDGRRLVAGFLMPGDFIGFSNATHYRHSIEAIVDSKLCAFPKTDMRALCQQHPALERELLDRACLELDATRDNLMSLARMTPLERLAAFLLDMAARRRRRGWSDAEVILPMTRTDIADYLGLTVETVSRSFTRLRQEGAIDTADPHHILLRDRARLEALAEARG